MGAVVCKVNEDGYFEIKPKLQLLHIRRKHFRKMNQNGMVLWGHIPEQHLRKMGERKKLRSFFCRKEKAKWQLVLATSAGTNPFANVRVNTNGSAPYSNNYYTATHTPKVTSSPAKSTSSTKKPSTKKSSGTSSGGTNVVNPGEMGNAGYNQGYFILF